MLIALLILGLLFAGDLYTTRVALELGGREANPVMRYLFKYVNPTLALLITKTALWAWLVYSVYVGQAHTWVLWLSVSIYAIVVGNNIYQINKVSK